MKINNDYITIEWIDVPLRKMSHTRRLLSIQNRMFDEVNQYEVILLFVIVSPCGEPL